MKNQSSIGGIATTEQIIADAQSGKMFVLVDHKDRENEGDLVIPAEKLTAEKINFMATYGRGLICLALTSERLDALGIPLMAASNSSRHETAFTVSIDSKRGITTGISAHDRALTIKTAIKKNVSQRDIVSPGHVFPLVARSGGVLERAGHTEAAVDIANIAGLNPSGVICEIMSDDGTMARLPELLKFAKQHDLKIGTVSDLIKYRLKNSKIIQLDSERKFQSEMGKDFKLKILHRTQSI